ncbi:MAG: helix-turn-helix domain-containing protein [Promethearchaeia archaeon]
MDLENPTLARVKIKFPDNIWISHIFHEFNDVRLTIAYFLPYDLEKSIGNAMIEIQHWNIDSIIDEIRLHPSVMEFTVLEKEENRVKFNVKTEDPYLLYGLIKCGVLVNFPVRVKEGYAYWRLISTRKRIDQLLTIFDRKGIDYTVLRMGNSPYDLQKEEEKLSLEEKQILNKAIEEGFFEVPRNISLEDLANKVGKSKSTLSVLLRKIIKKKVMIEH